MCNIIAMLKSLRLINNLDFLVVFLVVAAASFGLFACSGGGASGSGSSKEGIRLVHMAIDSSPVDLYSSLDVSKLIARSAFGEINNRQGISDGLQILSLTTAKIPSDVVKSLELNWSGGSQTLLYYGNHTTLGLATSLIDDQHESIDSGMSLLRIIHALVGAASVSANISGNGSVGGIGFGSASNFIQLPEGNYNVKIKREVDQRELSNTSLVLSNKSANTIVIGGEVDYFVAVRQIVD